MIKRNFSLKIIVPFLILLIACNQNNNQSPDHKHPSKTQSLFEDFSQSITRSELKKHVVTLASDEMEGRFSTTKGAQKAAYYIIDNLKYLQLKSFPNLEKQYFQKFKMQKKKLIDCYLENENGRVKNWEDFGERFITFSGDKEAELIFVGYGRDSDFEGIDVNGKLVAFFIGDPDSQELIGFKERAKMKTASKLGAIGYLMISRDEKSKANYEIFKKVFYGDIRYYLYKSPEEALLEKRDMAIFPSAIAKLFGTTAENFLSVLDDLNQGKNLSGSFRTKVTMKTTYKTYETIEGNNILGYLEGSEKSDEWIIISAHYDHLGQHRGKTYNGADDNASGMAAVLEIAEAFSLASQNNNRPKRNILFLFPDAEEIGANGSSYFLNNPIIPLDNLIVDINIDAIGREDAGRADLKYFVYIYSSQEAKVNYNEINLIAKEKFKNNLRIEIKETPPGSDNFMFERKGVPTIAYTTGRSKDYHQPLDTANKINYDNLTTITKMIFSTVWEIANR